MSLVYYVYILTNANRTLLYSDVTNNLKSRLLFHQSMTLSQNAYTKKYKVFYLIYFEPFAEVVDAIKREKEIDSMSRKMKEELINSKNKNWEFLNDKI